MAMTTKEFRAYHEASLETELKRQQAEKCAEDACRNELGAFIEEHPICNPTHICYNKVGLKGGAK